MGAELQQFYARANSDPLGMVSLLLFSTLVTFGSCAHRSFAQCPTEMRGRSGRQLLHALYNRVQLLQADEGRFGMVYSLINTRTITTLERSQPLKLQKHFAYFLTNLRIARSRADRRSLYELAMDASRSLEVGGSDGHASQRLHTRRALAVISLFDQAHRLPIQLRRGLCRSNVQGDRILAQRYYGTYWRTEMAAAIDRARGLVEELVERRSQKCMGSQPCGRSLFVTPDGEYIPHPASLHFWTAAAIGCSPSFEPETISRTWDEIGGSDRRFEPLRKGFTFAMRQCGEVGPQELSRFGK